MNSSPIGKFKRDTSLARKRQGNKKDVKHPEHPNWNKPKDFVRKDHRDKHGNKKGDGNKKGGGKKKGGNKKKGHKSPFYKSARKLVKHEIKPQFQEIQRYIDMLRKQTKGAVKQENRLGTRTQNDLSAIFGRANEFNTEQASKIAQVMGQAQQGISDTYGTTSENIDNAYNKANESAQQTLQRLGITPVSNRLAEDQAWLQGLNEQNRGAASSALNSQAAIFQQGSGMLGQAIAGEGATQMGTAATKTMDAIRALRGDSRLQIGDLKQQRSDLRKNRGAMVNDAQQLLKQQAFEQMMEQAQLQALNKQRAADMKLDWARLNETAQYHQGQLQHDANRLAFDISKEQHDRWMDLHTKKNGSGNKTKINMSSLSGWGDAKQYLVYKYKKDKGMINVFANIIHSVQNGFGGQHKDLSQPVDRNVMYEKAVAYLKSKHKWSRSAKFVLDDIFSIGEKSY